MTEGACYMRVSIASRPLGMTKGIYRKNMLFLQTELK